MATDEEQEALLVHYDERLILDRAFVPMPRDGFYDPEDTETRESERYQPLRTIVLVSCYSAALGAIIVAQVMYIVFEGEADTERILAAALHVPLLILAGIMEGIIRLAHRRRQSLGYLEFYRQTKKLLPIPFQSAAYALAAMFLYQSWISKYRIGTQELWFLGISLLEGAAILIFDVLYFKRVLRHNRNETLPDARKYLHSPLTDIPDTRRRRRDVVFDNQIEVIRYLQKQRNDLRSEILRLRENIQRHPKQDLDVPIDDQKYLMASGEQRIRALRAEVEILKRESETAREKFMDRTEDAQRFQLLFEMQKKENQRLRGTLEEWSRRNAKLEFKLTQLLEARAHTTGSGDA